MSLSKPRLPPSFTSLYRLFLRASSASVLHHYAAKRHLRQLWRPTFDAAARVIQEGGRAGTTEAGERRRKWLQAWEANTDTTLSVLHISSQSRGLSHKLTRNLSYLHYGFSTWHSEKLNKPGNRWDPSPSKLRDLEQTMATLSKAKSAVKRARSDFDAQSLGALEEVVRMAEGKGCLHLGRAVFRRRRA
ncbi:hypothetical protein OF83DRAFT_1071082 [Amylostereum chailletii]|nr:hypothetical protein OF83DRAFT_1071082 [Amylostereum chailletii]